jgi:hypothetical protein
MVVFDRLLRISGSFELLRGWQLDSIPDVWGAVFIYGKEMTIRPLAGR